MKFKRIGIALIAGGLAAGCGGSQSGSEGDQASNTSGSMDQEPATVTVPAGMPLLVTLQDDLSTENSHEGDRFTAVLAEPLVVGSEAVLPAGSRVTGAVVSLAGPDAEKPSMTLVLTRAGSGDESAGISTVPLKLEGGGSTEGDLEKVAGGAVAGGILGAVVGGGKGAAVGAGAGAAAGTIVAIVTKNDQIRLDPGQKMQFTLREAAAFPKSTIS